MTLVEGLAVFARG